MRQHKKDFFFFSGNNYSKQSGNPIVNTNVREQW